MTDNKNSGRKKSSSKIKLIIYLMIGFLVFTTIIGIYLVRNAEDLAKNLLISQVNEQLAPHAEIEIEDFSFSVRPAAITLRNVKIAHTTPFAEIEPSRRTDSIRMFELGEASVMGVNLLRLVLRREWVLGTFTIDSLNVELVPFPEINETDSNDDPFVIPMFVSEVALRNSTIAYFRERDAETPAFRINDLSASVENIAFSGPDKPIHSYFEDFTFSTDTLSFVTKDNLYHLFIYSFNTDSKNRSISFSKSELIPKKSASQIAEEAGVQSDQYNFTAGPVKATGFDINKWLQDDELLLSSIIIENLDILINRDKTYPREERDHRLLPQQQLIDLPFVVSVDTIRWEAGSVRYIETYPQHGREGEISFYNMNVSVEGLQNHSRDDSVRVRASADFLDQIPIQADYLFSVRDNAGHAVSGTMGGFNLEMLNPIIENMAAKQIRSGILEEFRFNFHANEYASTGSIHMIYNNFELRFLDEESLEETRSRRLRSFFANRLRVRSANESDNPRDGTIDFERDVERSIFNYWWKTVLSGIEDIVIR